MEDENLAGNAQATAPENETASTPTEETSSEGNGNAPSEAGKQVSETRTYTQEQVNDIVRSRLDRASKAIYDRYGVDGEEGLDELIGMAQAYQTMKSKYDAMQDELKGLKEQNMFHANSVLPEKEDDVRTYFKGKGLEMSDEALKQVLFTHPEWLAMAKPAPTTTIVPLGSQAEEAPKPNEEAEAARMFGLSKFVN